MNKEALFDALDGLSAFDHGCTDSGIHDDVLKARVRKYMRALSSDEYRALVSEFLVSMFLSPERVEQGYGPEDAMMFMEWCEDEGI